MTTTIFIKTANLTAFSCVCQMETLGMKGLKTPLVLVYHRVNSYPAIAMRVDVHDVVTAMVIAAVNKHRVQEVAARAVRVWRLEKPG